MNFNYEYLEKRWAEFWNRENEDRPLISLTAPKGIVTAEELKVPPTLREMWLDTEYQLKKSRRHIANTHYLGEAFPGFNPNLGPDLVGAVCGCGLEFGERTSWAEPCIEEYGDFPPVVFDENNFWWKKICEITQAAVNDANGDYLVGITDLHPGADGLVSLRGPEPAAMDIYDDPEQFKQRVWEILPVFKEMAARLHEIISAKQKGCTNWMGIIHPTDLWYVTSCDFSCMISQADFEEFVVPELLAELDWLPASMYHLDGPGALRHLDRLLQMDKLKGVQWVYGAGQPSARYWLDVLKKIQAAGKCIQVACEPEDIVPVCEALDPNGVHLICGAPDKDTGEAMLKEMERIYRQKRGVFALK